MRGADTLSGDGNPMSIILPVERRSFKVRILTLFMYSILMLGGVTMVWPFLIMFGSSFSGVYDYYRFSPFLKCFVSESDRFMRVLAAQQPSFPRDLYPDAPVGWGSWIAVSRDPEGIERFTRPWLTGIRSPEQMAFWRRQAADFAEFNLGYDPRNSICVPDERQVGLFARIRYSDDLARLNADWGMAYDSFFTIRMVAEQRAPLHHVTWNWPSGGKTELFDSIKKSYRELYFIYGSDVSPEFIKQKMPLCRTRPFQLFPL